MTRIHNLLVIAVTSIFKNQMRSMLTSLGIIIGVCAVIVMVAVGSGSQKQIENQIQSLGTNVIIIFPSVSRSGGVSKGAGSFNRLRMDDSDVLTEKGTLFNLVSPIIHAGAQVIGNGSNWNTTIQGVSENYLQIRNWPLESGEFFTNRDIISRKKVAVIGKTIATELYPDEDPIGQKIRIRNTPFTIIGVLSEKGQDTRGSDQDDIIFAPSTTVLYRLKGGQFIDMIQVSTFSPENIPAAQEEIRSILREKHKLQEGEDDDFTIRNQSELTETFSSTSKTMTLLLGSIAAVSLLVGGIGIMNIMLVSVTERTREIGIRRSVGARSRDILSQFLTESFILSLGGGLLGIILAFIISYSLNRWTEIFTVIQPGIIVLSFSFSGAVGIFFGYYPARKASNLNPIDALRYE